LEYIILSRKTEHAFPSPVKRFPRRAYKELSAFSHNVSISVGPEREFEEDIYLFQEEKMDYLCQDSTLKS